MLLPVGAEITMLVLGVAGPRRPKDPLETSKSRLAAGKIMEGQCAEVREVFLHQG